MRPSVNEASSEELELVHLYEQAPIGLCVTDRQHRYLRINRRLCEINGKSREEHIGHTIHEVLPDIANQIVPMFQRVIDSGEPVRGHEVRGETAAPGGEARVFLGDHYPLRSEGGRVLYVHTMVQDITAQRRAEAFLKETNEELEARVTQRTAELESLSAQFVHIARRTAMGELVGSIAHELNQPLSAILANAEAALRFMEAGNPDIQEIREILQDIVEDDTRAGQIIRRLRTLLQKQAGPRERVQLDELVDQFLPLIRSEALGARARITLESAPNLPPVEADPVQLQQVIMNLLTNAIDAVRSSTSDGGDIRVVLSSIREKSVRVTVRDDGRGIHAESIGEVFSAFYTTKPNGLGMGLSVCRTIIEAHGGTIAVENLVPRGCSISFVLPLKSAVAF